jgi:hypothetical protein
MCRRFPGFRKASTRGYHLSPLRGCTDGTVSPDHNAVELRSLASFVASRLRRWGELARGHSNRPIGTFASAFAGTGTPMACARIAAMDCGVT